MRPFDNALRLAVAAVLAASRPVAAQERPDLPGIGGGARALGLGSSGVATAEGLFALGWNAAALVLLDRAEFGVSARAAAALPIADVRSARPDTTPYFSGVPQLGAAFDPLEFVGAALPFRIGGRQLAAGIAWRRYAEGVSQGSYRVQLNIPPNGIFTTAAAYRSSGGTYALSPTIAAALGARLRVGVTVNLLDGDAVHTTSGPREYTIVFPVGAVPGPDRRTHTEESNIRGTAIALGGAFDATPRARIAAQVTLPHRRRFVLDDGTARRPASFDAPAEVSVGTQLVSGGGSRFSAELRAGAWGGSVFREDSAGTDVVRDLGATDAFSLHLGVERPLRSQSRRAAVRAGGFVRRAARTDVQGKPIIQYGLSVGESYRLDRLEIETAAAVALSRLWARWIDARSTTMLRDREVRLAASVRMLRKK